MKIDKYKHQKNYHNSKRCKAAPALARPRQSHVNSNSKPTLPLKWHGGKSYLADWIIDQMPKHLHYVEPFAGGLAVLLAKNPYDERHQWGNKSHESGISEVVNDLNGELMNFWTVLQNNDSFGRFHRILQATPVSQMQWEEARTRTAPQCSFDVDAAVAFFIRCRQSRAGGFKAFATLSKNRTRRGINEQASAWLSCVEGLVDVHERLKRVVVLCDDALKVIRQQDGKRTLFYLDPPYVHSTRSAPSMYEHEMNESHHAAMLKTITHCQGRVILSGYPNELYDQALDGWKRYDRKVPNHVSGAKSKRIMTESLWTNF